MSRLKTLPARVHVLPSRTPLAQTFSDQRMAGRKLQSRRWRMWQADPHCAMCGRLVAFPAGFELDHVVALVNGGEDIDANCQVLCVDEAGHGCHEVKTRDDLGHAARN